MTFRRFSRIGTRVPALVCLLCISLHANPSEATETPKTQQPQSASPRVYEGMPAAELRALIGKPEKIVPVASKKGHAEVWIYRQLKHTTVDMVQVGTKPVIIRQKNGNDYVDVVVSEDPILKNRRTEVFAVASFLIVDGHYITCTQTEQKAESFF